MLGKPVKPSRKLKNLILKKNQLLKLKFLTSERAANENKANEFIVGRICEELLRNTKELDNEEDR